MKKMNEELVMSLLEEMINAATESVLSGQYCAVTMDDEGDFGVRYYDSRPSGMYRYSRGWEQIIWSGEPDNDFAEMYMEDGKMTDEGKNDIRGYFEEYITYRDAYDAALEHGLLNDEDE